VAPTKQSSLVAKHSATGNTPGNTFARGSRCDTFFSEMKVALAAILGI
jgi:hypothetical protein